MRRMGWKGPVGAATRLAAASLLATALAVAADPSPPAAHATVRKRQVVTYTLPTSRSGSLVLTVTSRNRPVRVDGIAALPT